LTISPAKVKDRAKRLAKLIRVAEHLLKLNSTSVLMSFHSAFNHSAVTRLRHTWALIPRGQFKVLTDMESLLTADSSYKNLRTFLTHATPPCTPYLGLYMKDLTFTEDGNPDMVNGLINFSKRRLLYRIISQLQQFQLKPYDIKPVGTLLVYLNQNYTYDENQLFNTSLEREPRGSEKSQIL